MNPSENPDADLVLTRAVRYGGTRAGQGLESFSAAPERIRTPLAGWAIAVLVIGSLIAIVWFSPSVFVPDYTSSGLTADELKAQSDLATNRNAVRGTLVQVVAGAFLLVTAYIAYGQLSATRAGQLTDRFTKTVGQLGDPHVEVRMAGIYALKQIARRPEYTVPIAEIYLAYLNVRGRYASPREPDTDSQTGQLPDGPRPDVQAVSTVLLAENMWNRTMHRPVDLSGARLEWVDLRGTDLRGGILVKVHMDHAALDSAKLQLANFAHAILIDTGMDEAEMEDAYFGRADLTKGSLKEAVLTSTKFHGTVLTGADLRLAKIELTEFIDTIMPEAVLTGARSKTGATFMRSDMASAVLTEIVVDNCTFDGAILTNAKFNKATVRGSTFGVSDAKAGPGFVACNLVGADFTEATLDDCKFKGADLSGAMFVKVHATGSHFASTTPGVAARPVTARLAGANLSSAKFVDCVFDRTDFDGANLIDADFTGSTFNDVTFRDCIISVETKFSFDRLDDSAAAQIRALQKKLRDSA